MPAVKVGLLGGSFDPVHRGHLKLARAILKDGCQEVWFLPCVHSPLKQRQLTDYQHRVNMLKLALKPFKKMKVCTIEEHLPSPSYTVETLKLLKKKYPYEFVFYIGNDQAKQLDKWKEIETCMKLATFKCFKRDSEIVECPYPMEVMKLDRIDLSSSDVRSGHFYGVVKSVRRYIWENCLYFDEFAAACMNEKRYLHSKSVARVCEELALKHHLNEQDAYTIGLLHDICKCWPVEKSVRWMNCYEKKHLHEAKAIWHGYLAAHYLNRLFGFCDKHILKAIYHHVKGECRDAYAQIVYIADKCEPLRGYDASYELSLAEKNLETACKVVKVKQLDYIQKENRNG